MSMEPKKLALIRILQILEQHTDANNPLRQEDILNLLKKNYDIELERKAVGRNLSLLNEAGYEVIFTPKGCYLGSRILENSEIRLLMDSVLCSRVINSKHSADLIKKLAKLGGKHFCPISENVCLINEFEKSENMEFFYTVDSLDEAISSNKKVTFDYNKFGIDKRLHRSSSQKVTPYQMVLHRQRYYLMCFNDHFKSMCFYRIDKLSNIEILEEAGVNIRSVKGYENGIDYQDLSCARPYMFSDKSEAITIVCHPSMMDDLVDWFGKKIDVKKEDEKTLKVVIRSSPNAFAFWALQFGESVEVIAPESLRAKMKDVTEKIAKKYQ